MGLRCDDWRRSLPSAVVYRPWVRRFFDGVDSFAGNQSIGDSGEYTPEAAALRAGMRSGQALVLNFTIPCPATPKVDCMAIWVAWGECEVDGSGQIMRYTIEADAMGGGEGCAHEDGFTQKVSC